MEPGYTKHTLQRKLNLILMFSVLLVFSGCDGAKKKLITDSTQDEKTQFNPKEAFDILDITMSLSHPSSAPDSICSGWNISKQELPEAIRKAVPIDLNLWHYQFDHLPCVVEGTLRQDGGLLSYSINAGAYFTISNTDTVFYFGIYDSTSLHYFLSEPWTED